MCHERAEHAGHVASAPMTALTRFGNGNRVRQYLGLLPYHGPSAAAASSRKRAPLTFSEHPTIRPASYGSGGGA